MGCTRANDHCICLDCPSLAGYLVGVVMMQIATRLNEIPKREKKLFETHERTPLAHVTDLSVSYKEWPALEKVNGVLYRGSLTAVVGPNGGGKSTFLKALTGLLKPERGQLRFHGTSFQKIAYLPQQSEIDKSFPLTVRDVIALGLCPEQGFFHRFQKDILKRADQALARVGLPSCGKRSLQALSGGQLQRVLFARLIVQDADLLLLDEPFNAVDAYTIEDLMRLIVSWQAEGRTVVVVSHDIDLVREFFPESILMAREVLGWGKTEDVVTLENLKEAKKRSRTWETCVESCLKKAKIF